MSLLVRGVLKKSKYAFIDSNFARSLPATFDKELEREKFPFFSHQTKFFLQDKARKREMVEIGFMCNFS